MSSALIGPTVSRGKIAGLLCLATVAIAILGAMLGLGARPGSPGSSTAQADRGQEQFERARALIKEHRITEARKIIEDGPVGADDPGHLELLGIVYEMDGALEQAEACWRRALSRDPNHAAALLDLGRLELSRRQLGEAVTLLQRAAELSPHALDPVYNLSRAYRLSGDTVRAEQLEKRAEDLRRSEPPRGGMGEP